MAAEAFRVTAAIPAYNEGPRLATTIASVRAQTEPPSEILVIDDGSSDDTAAVATALGARVVSQPNAGIARSRNRLFEEARSPWIAFLDGDDVWYPEKLGAVRRAHEAYPEADFIISDLSCTRDTGEVVAKSVFAATRHFANVPRRPVSSEASFVDRRDLGRSLAVGNFIGTSTVVANRERILARGIAFEEHLPADADVFVAEDVEWYLRVLRTTDALAIGKILGEYRLRANSLASNYGRVRYGDAKLGERVLRAPDAYVDGCAPAFVAARRQQLRHAARIYTRARDFGRAADILREAERDRPHPFDAAAIAFLEFAKRPAARTVTDALEFLWDRSRSMRSRPT